VKLFIFVGIYFGDYSIKKSPSKKVLEFYGFKSNIHIDHHGI